jgi:prepilin-type processing-associated H-X9-DG protein
MRRRGSTVVSLLVLLGLAALFISILLPSLNRARETANRVKCANNMKQIGLAIMLYCNDNHGAYPRTAYKPGDTVIPDVTNAGSDSPDPFAADTKVPANCIASSYFLLVRTEDITSAVFVCPSTGCQQDTYGGAPNTAATRSNFTSLADNLSYSFANPFPDNAAFLAGYKLTNALDPGFVIAGDQNPGFSDGSNVLKVTLQSPASEARLGNSHNHGRDGQNFLYADGHVEFDNTILVGLDQDNVYCRGRGGPDATRDDVVNSPKDAGDSVLLPAAGE